MADALARAAALAAPLARAAALAGGLVLLALAVLVTGSVAARWCCDRPLTGDVELVQAGCALAIALFLPWCMQQRGHITVDLLTARLPPRSRRRLDALGALLMAAACALLAWRAAVGVTELAATGESTMLLGLPSWLVVLGIVPGMALAAGIALLQAVQDWRR